MAIQDNDLLDCFLHLPQSEDIPFVLAYNTIRNAHIGDARLQALQQSKPNSFMEQLLAPDTNVKCYILEPHALWKTYLLPQLLTNAICWYHHALGHLFV